MTTQEKAQSILKHGNCSHVTCGLCETDTPCPLLDLDCSGVTKRSQWPEALVNHLEAVARGDGPGQEREEMLSVLRDVDFLLQGTLSGNKLSPDKLNFVHKRVKAILYR